MVHEMKKIFGKSMEEWKEKFSNLDTLLASGGQPDSVGGVIIGTFEDEQGQKWTAKEFGGRMDNALEQALNYVTPLGGFVASIPQIVAGRIKADFENEIWTKYHDGLTEELAGKTEAGNEIMIEVHGGGIWTPERMRKAYADKLVNGAGRLTEKEFMDIANGKLPDAVEIPHWHYSEFVKKESKDLPIRYAVITDFKKVKNLTNGLQPWADLYNNPLIILRAGGVEQAHTYLDRAKKRHSNYNNYGCWHQFSSIDTNIPQGRLVFLGNDDDGFNGDYGLNFSNGRFVGVAPEAHNARKIKL